MALCRAGEDEGIAGKPGSSAGAITGVLHKHFMPRNRSGAFIAKVRAGGCRVRWNRSEPPGGQPDLIRTILIHIPSRWYSRSKTEGISTDGIEIFSS